MTPSHRGKPQPMFRKMHLILVGLVVLTSLLTLLGAFFVVNRAIEKVVQKEIETEIKVLLRFQAEFKVVSIADAIDFRTSPAINSPMIYLLIRSDGSPIVGNIRTWPESVPKQEGWHRFEINEPDIEAGKVLAKVVVFDDVFPVLVGRRLSLYETLIQEFMPGLAWMLSLLAIVLTFIVVRSSRQFATRIVYLNTVLKSVQGGQLHKRIDPVETQRNDDLADLSRHINTAPDENSRLMMGLDAVSQTAAHEINKELGHLRDLAQANEQTELVASANSLLKLLGEILELSKIESSAPARMIKIELMEVAMSAADLYQDAFDDAGIELIVPKHSAQVLGQSHLLTNAVANLLNNALKYTPVGGSVTVSIENVGDAVVLQVADTGLGTESDDLQEILQQAQEGKVAGYGFGLRFVQAVAIRHGATLRIANNSFGFTLSIHFPVMSI